MLRLIGPAIALALISGIALAQQSTFPKTPGVDPGTTGTTYGTPGGLPADPLPGGGIAHGAGSQDASRARVGLTTSNNSADKMPGTTMPGTSMPGTSSPGTSMPGTTMPGGWGSKR